MKPDDDLTKPPAPVDDKTTPDEPPEPPLEGTLTAEDIAEIEASGLTLGDYIRELESRAE